MQPLTPLAAESSSCEAKAEISLNDRSFTILSTASLPPPPKSKTPDHSHIQTLTPRHKPNGQGNEILYELYKQRLTNPSKSVVKKKRSLPMEKSNVKRFKQPEVIVLD